MKKFNLLLSAAMLIGAVAAVNCEIITRKVVSKEATSETEIARDKNAEAIKKAALANNPEAKSLEVKRDGKYMVVVLRDEDKAGYEVTVYDIDTNKVVLNLIPSEKIRTFDLNEGSLVLKWTGFWRTETTYSLGKTCKKCGKFKTRIGAITKTRAIYGWAPCL
ncbi:hypothetical protein ACFLYU_05050 [Candidatus Dependentiae bacterium]